ncbi:MAG: Outer membrane protein assembly factor BamE [Immundisolibacter sp.]|nr:Outer membrane protein assembly factor BamE [Immundisolibacter sp.]
MPPRPELIPMQRLLPAVALVLLLTGCAGRQPDAADARPLIPALAPYRMDIRQGNVVDAAMLARLQPGMDRERVRALLGTPQLRDPFRPERWDYTYTERKGYEMRAQRTVTLLFEGDRLARVEGDVLPVAGAREKNLLTASTRTTVDVPAQAEQSGSRLARLIGGVGSEDGKKPGRRDLARFVETEEARQYETVEGTAEATATIPSAPSSDPQDGAGDEPGLFDGLLGQDGR